MKLLEATKGTRDKINTGGAEIRRYFFPNVLRAPVSPC